MDALTRYHRMRGFNTLWLPGTDHAGIATQIVVERQLQDEGKSRHDLGRKNFVAQVWEWKQESGNTITGQMRRIGDTVDWTREYFTMDATQSAVVNETFVRLYEEGLIYRGKRLVSWDPVLQVGGVGSRGRERRGGWLPLAHPLSAGRRQRVGGGRHDATRNHARRHGGDGSSGRRALRRADRQAGVAAVVRADDPGHCRHLCRPRVRHRRGQGHAGARRQRLCRRPAPWPGHDRRADPGRQDQRQRAGRLPRPGPLRRAQTRGGRPRGPGLAGRDPEAQADGAALRTHWSDRRADADRPVVRGHDQAGRRRRVARRARDACRRTRRRALRAAAVGQHLEPVDEEHPGLVHLAPALVGPPDSGLVRQRRRTVRGAQREPSASQGHGHRL